MPTTRALYSLASSVIRPVTGWSGTRVASTHSAAPGPVTPVPIWARVSPRTTAALSPLGRRPTCSRTATVPIAAYLPSNRGTTRTLRSALLAASTADWISASSRRRGTTMPGSTTESESGSTGSFSVSVMPSSTVTPLNLFQCSRKSAVGERRNLERQRLYSTAMAMWSGDGAWVRMQATLDATYAEVEDFLVDQVA